MSLDLTLATYDYAWTRPLRDGRVTPEGVDLTVIDYPNPERFTRMADRLEFDACEFSMGSYLATRATPEDYPFTAIPVFPYRKLRHSYVYVRDDAGIESPAALNGARIGLVNWQTTTGIWQRGTLAERHGLDLESVEWVVSGSEIVPVDTTEFDVTYLDSRSGSALPLLEAELDRGDLDALFVPVVPRTDRAVRLFDDPLAVERAYVAETGIVPIMHGIVLKDAVIEANPWVVRKLYDAFDEAKALAMATLEEPRSMPLVWSRLHADEQRSVVGPDPWQYGLTERNRTTLETLVGYAHDQGIAAERYAIEDLFALEPLDAGWFGAE